MRWNKCTLRSRRANCCMPIAGLTLDEGWRVEIKQRATGNSAGTKDAVRSVHNDAVAWLL